MELPAKVIHNPSPKSLFHFFFFVAKDLPLISYRKVEIMSLLFSFLLNRITNSQFNMRLSTLKETKVLTGANCNS